MNCFAERHTDYRKINNLQYLSLKKINRQISPNSTDWKMTQKDITKSPYARGKYLEGYWLQTFKVT